ncbi:hypothetical protein [Geoglobus ahangari]
MKLPHSSFYSETRRLLKQGKSYGISFPAEFVKALETLGSRDLRVFNLNNTYIVSFAEKTHVNDNYDLVQLILTALEALNTITDDKEAKEKIFRAYELIAELQNTFDEPLDLENL